MSFVRKKHSAAAKIKFHAQINNFAKKYPDLAQEWHPTKNIDLTAKDVSVSSNKKVWWKCCFCGNEWQSTVNHRTAGRGCPKCSKAGTSKCEQIIYYYVQKAFPDAINRYSQEYEFDIYIPTQNVAIEYDGTFFHKNKKVFERDNKKDEFCQTNGIKLIRFRSPQLKDTISAQRITCEDYDIETGIRKLFLLLNAPCPDMDLSNDIIKITNNFRATIVQKNIANCYPDIAKEWHPTKNKNIPIISVLPMSNMKYWWKCSVCEFEWMDTPNHRCGRNSGCPLCAGKVVIAGINDLATQQPIVAKEWNCERNGALAPSQVSWQSNKKVWWKCLLYGHEWRANICDRTRIGRTTNCPYCGNKKILVGFNDLATTHPQLAKEWNHRKNGGLTPKMVTAGSRKKVWWICEMNHEWETYVYSRKAGRNCPICSHNKQQHKSY